MSLAVVAAGLCSVGFPAEPAEARLGEEFASYKSRVAKNFKAAGEKKSGEVTSYLFQVPIEEKQQAASPGYALGITISCNGGKITGQSMAVRPGANPLAGGTMAAIHGFAFAYEAIGKQLPTDPQKAESQFKAFSEAIGQAFLGKSLKLSYPGYGGKITLTKDPAGNLIIAARP